MKRLTTLAAALLVSLLLALPAWAAPPEQKPAGQLPPQAQAGQANAAEAGDPHQGAAFKRQQSYMQKREAMKKHRDEALKIRENNVENNNPGKTGL
ncbi:MAG: hypothetical protein FDZ69_10780 [Deltaproteobacteria bacterium]|nr:MAG: hypothetical protein FDZ69_10780 [Deltaproteobacteria bacterium]